MLSIKELINAKQIAAYVEELHSNSIPYLGTAIFPHKRMVGLKLEWVKGYDNLPVMLMPAAFDAQPTLRDRGGVENVGMRMPFFREAMRIGEEERQQLLSLINAQPNMAIPLVEKLYDDVGNLVASAYVNPEVMRMELLQKGTITIQTVNDNGIVVNYNYDYDQSGKWKASNVTTASTSWGQPNSDPINDIIKIKRAAAAKGVALTRAIIGPKLWAKLADMKFATTTPGIVQQLSDSELASYLSTKTGITFTVYEKMYKGLDGTDKSYMLDDHVVFLPSTPVGSTYFGTTPEEADLLSGNADGVDVEIVGGGIAVGTKLESLPVNILTWVSEIVLPSFEKMNQVYVFKMS